ncbi:hypothetical protein [Nocardioides sp.]|jgi:hypothetical protein|uniref:hypothetical protein n=1 Tax=Nocardioides sp. TaxID=35761 RepID=UPI001D5D8E3E|nr:hypothetical protein [Nocardioides sp.]MBU1801187.1 hypothetical protein [Actinomycetota bacterium]
MGGGWGKQGSGIPLSERVRAGAAPAPSAAPGPSGVAESCPARHCWVADAVDGHGVKRPGLLVEWRQVPEGWEGRVVYAARVRQSSWLLVEEWLPAALLTPM